MTLGLVLSCLVQGALVLAPLRGRGRRRLPVVGLLVPVAALALGVGLLRAFAAGPRALALLAAVATPLLAGCVGWAFRWRRPWLALVLSASLYLVAWQSSSFASQAAAVALVGLACLTLAATIALVAPPREIGAGLVLLAVVDVVLVWGAGQVGPATTALAHASLPTPAVPLLPHRPLPALQQATFGSVAIGWLDVLAPALLCAMLVPRLRPRAAIAVTAAAGLWSLLLLVTSTIPATVPVVVGLLVTRGRRRSHRRGERAGRSNAPESQAAAASAWSASELQPASRG
jgi:hypothetical protein